MALAAMITTGLVAPPLAAQCQLQSSQSVQDFGHFSPYELETAATGRSKAGSVSVGQRFIQLNVTCVDSSRMAILFRGTGADGASFTMGDNGHFNLTVKDALVDGQPVNLGQVLNVGALPEQGSSSVDMLPGYYVVPLALSGLRLQSGRTLSMRVEINAYLKSDRLKIRDVTPFQGQVFFELDSSPAPP